MRLYYITVVPDYSSHGGVVHVVKMTHAGADRWYTQVRAGYVCVLGLHIFVHAVTQHPPSAHGYICVHLVLVVSLAPRSGQEQHLAETACIWC